LSRQQADRSNVVQFEGVGVRYGHGPEIVQDIEFALPAGSFHFLTGPSGAGKSSLLRLMYLAQRPSRGRIQMFGTDVATARRYQLPALRRRVGVVFQDFRLLDHLSAYDNVALPLRLAGWAPEQVRTDVTEMLSWVGLSRKMAELPATLSGGEQQRVAIARAVVARPALLLADEPTGNLDEAQAQRLMGLFLEMNRLGTTVVMATHNNHLVDRFPARALVLDQGHLVQHG